jgi:hypothetical protein
MKKFETLKLITHLTRNKQLAITVDIYSRLFSIQPNPASRRLGWMEEAASSIKKVQLELPSTYQPK